MAETTDEEERAAQITYRVVKNHEDQYSIWPADKELPRGWPDVGQVGPKQRCLDFIEEGWTDMRPRSLREQMEQQAKSGEPS